MESSCWITADQPHEWENVLHACAAHDVFHTLGYHQVNCGEPYLFHFQKDGRHAAFPLLLRELPESSVFPNHCDATSVYGYPGPLASLEAPDPEFAAAFQCAFRRGLENLRVVSLFSRLHPRLANGWLLEGFCTLVEHGQTVWIDLRQEDAAYEACCSREHRKQMRRAERNGFKLIEDAEWAHIDDFLQMYYSTMERNEAGADYYFPEAYFRQLAANLGTQARLFFLEHSGQLVTSVLVLGCQPFLAFFLSGTRPECLHLRCVRPLYDAVRRWGRAQGFLWLNLGGGVGNQHDSLFEFKATFSDLRQPFFTARLILDHARYAELSRIQDAAQAASTLAEYFPAYRSPQPAARLAVR